MRMPEWNAAAVFAGFLLDCLFGDPLGRWHPVALIGRLIPALEGRLRPRFPQTPAGERAAGACMALLTVLAAAGAGAALLYAAWRVSPWAYFAVGTFLCWQCLAARCLRDEAVKVVSRLEDGGLAAARRQVGTIVGRDTGSLSEAEVLRAAVETVAENTSDGVVAPLFWMALAGPAGGLFYKAVNTMDSMVGYRNDRYMHFGTAAARLDDAVNYLPARLSALLMIAAAAALPGFDGRGALRVWRRDRRKHASPNSAQTESACAGALGLRLGGDASYFGVVHHKPTLGDPAREIRRDDVRAACRLMYGTTAAALLLYAAVFMAAGGLR